MKHQLGYRLFREGLSHFLPPEVWKQAHQVYQPAHTPSRWTLHPLIWMLLTLSWVGGDSQEEKFAAARAAYVGCHQRDRRPGATLAGFLKALSNVPMYVFRALARGVRARLEARFVERLRINGFLPVACDGTRLNCPRSEELQQRLGEAGKADACPMVYLTALVLLPLGLPWSWCLGKGTASEHDHLRRLLPTLPRQSLIVADAFYLGYELFQSIVRAPAFFLVRMSSRACLYTLDQVCLERFREGVVYYWPETTARDKGLPPIQARLLRIRGQGADVWLLTNVLDPKQLSHQIAGQLYRWRWRNEGLFRVYKRMLGKVKLQSRTVAAVHREAEVSLLALQLLLAMAAEEIVRGKKIVVIVDSPRRLLLRLRGEITGLLRSLGPRQFTEYQRMLTVVRSQARQRSSAKVRQEWPRRKEHKPPKPPKIRVMDEALKTKLAKVLQDAAA